MKKIVKALSVAVSIAMLASSFVACKADDDEEETKVTSKPVSGPTNPGSTTDVIGIPESVVTPDLSKTPKTAGEIKINDAVFSGTFAEAIASLSSTGDYVITLAPGTYESNNVHYKGNANIKIKGLGTAKYGADVILAGKGDNDTSSTEKNRSTFEYEGSGTLILENITIKNTLIRSESPSKNTQCEALGFDGAYCAAYNCGFFAYQDTVRTIGKSWFYGCYIEGDVDFMWMEKSGKVALYENCAIKTVYDTSDGKTPSAYILAPGMTAADTFNKGLVVWNSAVYTSVTSDFFRNPWGVQETLYNIGAFLNIKLEGKENLSANLQKSTASNWDLNDAIGWKIDQALADEITARSSEIHVIPEAVEAAEFNGRNRIINRVYKLNPGKYANDPDVWDVNKLAKDNGWKVVEDTSKLDEVSDDLKANGVYDLLALGKAITTGSDAFADKDLSPLNDGTSSDTFVSWTNLSNFGAGYGAAVASGKEAVITIDVAGDSIVSFKSSVYSSGTVTVTDAAGNTVLNTYPTKVATDKSAIAFGYSGPATKLTLKITGTSYVNELTVTKSEGEKAMVTKVVISGDDAVTIDDTISLKAIVTTQYCADASVTWTSDKDEVATVDANGNVKGIAEGEAIITATSVFDSTKKATLKVTVTGMPSSKAVFFESKAAGMEAKVSDTSLISVTTAVKSAAGKNANGSDCSIVSWDWNDSKNGIMLSTNDDNPEKGEWYIEYPITAVKNVVITKANIKWGATGTGNFFAYVTYVDAEGVSTVISDDKANVARDTVNESSTFVFNKEVKAGTTAKIRISIHGDLSIKGSTGYQILASNKVPIWGKTEITCQSTEKDVPTAEAGTNNLVGLPSTVTTEWKNENKSIVVKCAANNGGHGLQMGGADNTITVNLAGPATIKLATCRHNNSTGVFTITENGVEKGSVTIEKPAACNTESVAYAYTGSDAATIVLTAPANGQFYLEKIVIE